MSSWGTEVYQEAGKPIMRDILVTQRPAYVLVNSPILEAALPGTTVDTEFFAIAERPDGEPAPAPDIMKITPAQVVREALDAVARDRARVIPGWIVWAMMSVTALVPIFVLRVFLNLRGRNFKGH